MCERERGHVREGKGACVRGKGDMCKRKVGKGLRKCFYHKKCARNSFKGLHFSSQVEFCVPFHYVMSYCEPDTLQHNSALSLEKKFFSSLSNAAFNQSEC